jgi:hypothetical protein
MQKKAHSAIESTVNIIIGCIINIILQTIVYTAYGWSFTLKDNFIIMFIFTFASFARSYCLRRIFTRITE